MFISRVSQEGGAEVNLCKSEIEEYKILLSFYRKYIHIYIDYIDLK